MLQINEITNLFEEFFRILFYRTVSRMFLDSMTIWYFVVIFFGYYRRIYGKFLDIILYSVNIQKVSAFCDIGVD